ncbi:MAG: metallophosphoesterase [Methanosarcinales archaeon Met12]|nr:MAG: metallophosphoesterase [Methanosarcinales archaeon Met12]
MKLLAISDTHGDFSKISSILGRAGKVDAILVAGDITNFGPKEKAKELFDIMGNDQPVMAIPGNCDPKGVLDVIEKSGAVSIHNSSFKFGDTTFIGLGGSNPTPFSTPFEMSEDEIRGMLRRLLPPSQRDGRVVLVSHAPPKNSLDAIHGAHVGSEAIREILSQVDLVVCGHIHEARGVVRSGNTTIMNPGQASRGLAAVVDIGAEIEVAFIDGE